MCRERLLDGTRQITLEEERLLLRASIACDSSESTVGVIQQQQRRHEGGDVRTVNALESLADKRFGFVPARIVLAAWPDSVTRTRAGVFVGSAD